VVRAALAARQKLAIRYQRADGSQSERVIRPLGAFFWGKTWTLTAWCELRQDFRNFRLDRMQHVEATAEDFEDEPGQSLRDYLRTIGRGAEGLLGD
jgi:predicted DNA-binding transcriptional regulator YafY